MKRYRPTQQGVTLVELLIVIVVLSVILGGVYGLLATAQEMYMNTRAMTESQNAARVVMNYLVYRLREMDGGGSGSLGRDPRRCADCHVPKLDAYTSIVNNPEVTLANYTSNNPNLICTHDVLLPRRNLFLDALTEETLPALPPTVDTIYKDLGDNTITFWADLLPDYGQSDTFSNYTSGIPYIDFDGDDQFDYFGEKWTYRLRKPANKKFFELVESLTFESYSSKNESRYEPYTAPVAYGITGLGIAIIPNYTSANDFFAKMGPGGVQPTSLGSNVSCVDAGCHTTGGVGTDYGTTATFNYNNFISTHGWWNIKGFSIEVATTDPTGRRFIKMKQYVVPRNVEVNKQ